MADQTTIDSVTIQLATEAADLGIDDSLIGVWLDSGLSPTKAILAGWRAIAAKTVGTEDVSEAGSSRTIRLHERAMALVIDWQARADAEDVAAGALPKKLPGRSHTAVRV